MDVLKIPFAEHTGIEHKADGSLILEPMHRVQNHMQTIHASAQFTLAETKSGFFLQEQFPELVGKAGAVLRSSTVKYKAPATTAIEAKAALSEADKEKFLVQLNKKGRATLTIETVIYDEAGVVTMVGEFVWFVQKLDVS